MEEHGAMFALLDNNGTAAVGPEVAAGDDDVGLTGQLG